MQFKQKLVSLKNRPDAWVVMAAALAGAVAGAYMVRSGTHAPPIHGIGDALTRLEHAGLPPRMLLAMAIWLPIGVYWEVAARKAGEKVASEASTSRLVHLLLIAAGQILLVVPVAGLRGRFIPLLLGVVIAGLAIEAASAFLALWSRHRLGRNWSGAIATVSGQQLVRTGPYRLVRHPMYTGLLGLYIGTAIVSGELHALIGLILVCIAYWRKIRMEETHLREHFGTAYDEYRRTTWALVPGVI